MLPLSPAQREEASVPMASTSPQESCARAKACEQLAETATNPETREMLLYLAKRWRDLLADEDEAREARHPDLTACSLIAGRPLDEYRR